MTPWKTVSREEILRMGRYLTVEKHAVQLANGTVIPDWAWVITPDFVTVAALTAGQRFLCFRQTKYAVEGTSLAPVGGFIEPGETPLQAAHRELLEETGFEAPEWLDLGSYAVDANRGCGKGYFFFAKGARRVAEIGEGDLEEQELLELDLPEVEDALRHGGFKTLAWVSVMALALDRLKS